MEKIIKCPKRQDCHYKLTPGISNETSINLSNEVFKYIQPEGIPSDTAIEVSFNIYKDDYIKALCHIVNMLPLYKTGSGTSTKVTYCADFFASQYESIYKFFGEDSTAIYHAKLLNRGDGRIYLNDLNNNGFNIRRFLIESNSVLFFVKDEDLISIRLESGEDIFKQYSTTETECDNVELIIAEKDLKAYIHETVKYLSKLDGLNSLIPFIATVIQPESQIKIASNSNTPNIPVFSLTGMFIETTEKGLEEKNTNKDTGKPKPRWFTEKFSLDGHTVYLSGEWYGKENDPQGRRTYNLTLKDFNTMLDVCYPNMFQYSYENNRHTLKGVRSIKAMDYKQTIYFGSPGTGKSFKIKDTILNGISEDFIFRTTFHPDTDYASFVGCYKPISKPLKAVADTGATEDEVIEAFYKTGSRSDKLKASFLAEAIYHDADIDRLGLKPKDIVDKLEAKGFDKCTYGGELAALADALLLLDDKLYKSASNITYEFVAQTFTNAYIKAWKNPTESVYLVIEEINRGNCAQIFGDIFQLLDRKPDGFSEYKIKADRDLAKYLEEKLGPDCEGIKNGELCLPPNLSILATMNTSDQSLFPMDSAFKRRWDWEYIPIDTECQKSQFVIDIDGKKYSWAVFIEKVNEKILYLTESEDKQLGNFFIKKDINKDEFKSKVMFYLWSEVCKDYYNSGSFFKYMDGSNEIEFTFNNLYKGMDAEILQGFMQSLGVTEI